MSTHNWGVAIAWGFFALFLIAVIWAVSGLKHAHKTPVNRKWWWAIGFWMSAKAVLFGFLYVVWISDFFERWMYAVIVWGVVLAYLNAFIRWMRLGDQNGRKPS